MMVISKSNYMQYLRHPALLWLKKHEKFRLPKTDPNTQATFDAGHLFESYVDTLYPDAVTIGFDKHNFDTYKSMPERTKLAINDGVGVILQGRLESNGITAIFDILERVDGDEFDLIEVKSSTKVKAEHEYDLAFQFVVLQAAGIRIRNVSVIHVNNEYVREGEIDPEQISTKTDVTGAVHTLIEQTKEFIQEAKGVVNATKCPHHSPRYANHKDVKDTDWFKDWLAIFHHLHPKLDTYSVYNLSYPNASQIGMFEDQKIMYIKDIPDDFDLKPMQQAQATTTKSNTRIIDVEQIASFLNDFQFPLYFLDYETCKNVIPDFDGVKPYQQVPFQYSLHVLSDPEGEVEHFEYLHKDSSYPALPLLEKLRAEIGSVGTILVWYQNFEKSRNKEMAHIHPEYADFLEDINSRIVDLMIPFSDRWFVDKDFMGSASIKKVQPVLVPDLDYKGIAINNGGDAQRIWMETFLGGKHENTKEEIEADLLKYCEYDTLIMVKIWEQLRSQIHE